MATLTSNASGETDLAERAADPIDLAVLGRFTASNRELQVEVLKLFADHLPTPLDLLGENASAADWRYATHTIKGAARAVGASTLAAVAAEAEAAPSADRGRHTRRVRAEAEVVLAFVHRFTALAAK
jgi:HPt (histidine-containing phosphotransfer) domain-containing protein